jgi:Porin subfamily
MTVFQRILLGCILASSTAAAHAADLPGSGATPVEYVRVCSAYGAGFFYVPGSTDTCLRVGGRVRAELSYIEPFSRNDNAVRFRARGRLNVDSRTATEYGIVRAYIRYEITQDTPGTGSSDGLLNQVVVSPNLTQAFVQFGGLTAGKVVTFFTDPDLPAPHFGDLRYNDPSIVNVPTVAYTFAFGSGLSATIGIEEGLVRRAGDVGPVTAFAPGTDALLYGGQTVPDVVGNIRWKGTWGSTQLAGAVHQIRDIGVPPTLDAGGVVIPGTGRPFADTEYGWAVGFHGIVNLPFLGATDSAWWSTAYTQGALSYLGFNGLVAGPSATAGLISVGTPDAVVNVFTNELEKAKGLSIAGGFTHYWVPTLQTNLFGSYARIDYAGIASAIDPVLGNVIGFPDLDEWRLGTNTIWTPVQGLDLGLEVLYIHVDPQGRVLTAGTPAAPVRLTSQDSALEGRFRIQRDF